MTPFVRRYPLSSHMRETVLKVARHEAGHLIAANVVGFKTGGIEIELTDIQGGHRGGAEIILPRPLRSLEDTMKYLSDRVVVLWAGSLAESLTNGKVVTAVACDCLNSGGAMQDKTKVTELLNLLRNLRFPDVIDAEVQASLTELERELWTRTIEIVEAEQAMIIGYGDRVAQLVKMTGTKYTLTAPEITGTTNFIARFGRKGTQ